MKTNIYIDPDIDLNSEKEITIIIQFKTKPANTAISMAKMAGVSLTLEQAERDVENSHARFQEDVKRYLGQKHIPYTIKHIYKTALNGVAMILPANKIKTLLQSAEIESIHANKEYHLDPPVQSKLF